MHNPHTEFLSKLGSVFQGTARLMYADNCIARASEFECLHKQTGSQALNYYRLSRTKMITMQLRCAYSENAN